MGLFLLIQTIPGANDILADRDDITVRFAWFYKRHWSFSQIDYATADHDGLHVFVKGRKRRACAAMAPLSVGTAEDYWRGGPRCHPALALPTISGICHSALALPRIIGAEAPDATQLWHCQRFPARLVSLGTVRGAPALQVAWNLPRVTVFAATWGKGDDFGADSVSLAPPRGARSPHVTRDLPRGTADVAEHLKGDFPSAAPVPLVAAYSKYAAVPRALLVALALLSLAILQSSRALERIP